MISKSGREIVSHGNVHEKHQHNSPYATSETERHILNQMGGLHAQSTECSICSPPGLLPATTGLAAGEVAGVAAARPPTSAAGVATGPTAAAARPPLLVHKDIKPFDLQ